MKFTLRPYQTEAVTGALDWLRTDNPQRGGLIVLPTASGKSLVIAAICHALDEPVLILQPSKELLEQNYAKLESYDITDIAIYSASKKTKEIAKFTYATIGSIIRKAADFSHFKYVIIDEAHLVAPGGQYTTFLRAIGFPRIIGLTATPYRLVTEVRNRSDGKQWSTTRLDLLTARGQFFDKILYQQSIAGLTAGGYLSPATYHVGTMGGLHQLRPNSSGSEFSEASLAVYWSETATAKLSTWLQSLPHNRTLVFVPGLDMAAQLAQYLGVEMIDGSMPDKQREGVLARFARGDTHTLVNVGVLTTGYDLPELEAVVLARPTMSLSLYVQMVGRGLRLDNAKPDKVAHIYDFGGNVGRFGQVEEIRLTPTGVWAGRTQITGVVLHEMCLSDLRSRQRA